ncbi:MAG: aminotransferase class IV, partial [Bacteroidota bacterium]
MFYDEDTILFLDGKFMKACEAGTDLYSHTLHYGLGVFEGLRAYRTVHGTNIFRAQEHFQRLIRSCSALDLPLDYTAEELTQISYQLIEQNG